MKKTLFILVTIFFAISLARPENLTLYTGRATTQVSLAGVSVGGDIWHFLGMHIDMFKYIKPDETLYSGVPIENRGDFAGASLNFVLKIPLHLIPYLHRLEFIQPYFSTGYGFGLENLAGEYLKKPDKDGNTIFLSKLIQYDSFGCGLIVMLTENFGIKFDYRKLSLSENEKMVYNSRSFKRFSIGICFGSYKDKIKK